MNRMKKTLALMLCFVMCLSLLPLEAVAEEIEIVDPVGDCALDVPQNEIDIIEPGTDELAEDDALDPGHPERSEAESKDLSEDSSSLALLRMTDETNGIVASGECGDNLTWTLDNEGTLTISGTGDMWNFSYGSNPWWDYRDSIRSVIINDGVTSIGEPAFRDCSKLTQVTIPDSVAYIGSSAFYGCGSLTEAVIPDGVTVICELTFADCSNLTSVTIPDSVTSIGVEAFYGCSSLTSVTIPNSVTQISAWAFAGCSSLMSVMIGTGVTSISWDSFSGCNSLIEIQVAIDNPALSSLDGVLFNKNQTTLLRYPCGKTGSYLIPNSVTSIGRSAFEGCRSLTSVTIPDSVTSIEGSVFSGCSSLTSMTIPDSVTSIDDSAFSFCDNLTEIRFEGSAPEIGWYCFSDVTATAYYPADDPSWTSDVMQNYGGSITWVSYVKPLPAPVLTEAFNSATGVRVSWKPVNGAAKYQLLRKNVTLGETKWKVVGETTDYTFIDTTAKSSNRYTYTVQTVNAAGQAGDYDSTGRTCTYIAKADITNLRCGVKGVSITWSKPAGAKNFRVMRRIDGTSTWTILAVIEGTTYTDTTAKIGTKYWYTVRGVSMDNKVLINSYNGRGWSIKPLNTPVLTEAFNSATGVRVSWKAVTGATKYRLLRKNLTKNETEWSLVTETSDLTFIDTTAVSASRYTYTVECVDSNSRICTAQGAARTCTYIAMSRITAIGSVSNGVKLVWSQPAGAKNFRVFRKTDGGQWVAIKDVMGTSFVDTTAQKGVKYWYTVRAITLAGDMYINSYNATGWSVTRK